ncbi:MAG: O-antigen ligase family protein [Chloroflexi bacterium]|nr:O-antigen ligase family protein [Chloroflexota bacterium]
MLVSLFGRRTLIGKLRYYFLERHYSQTIRYGLIFLCLALTLASTVLFRGVIFVGTDFLPGLIPVLAFVGLAAVVVLYNHLEMALLLVVVVSTLLADGIGTGTGTKITFTFLLAILVAGLWLFRLVVVDRHITLRPSPANAPAIIFIITVVISTVWSTVFVDQEVSYLLNDKLFPRLMTAAVLIISPLTMLIFAREVKSIRSIRFIIWWFILVGTIFGAYRLAFNNLPAPLNMRGQFPTWVGVLAIGQMLFNTRLHPVLRLFLGVVGGVWFYITIGLGISWLSGWVPLTFTFGILLLLYSRKLTALAMVGLLIFLLLNTQLVDEIVGAETNESGDTRTEAWERALNIYDDHFLFGTGPAGYAFYFATYLGPVGFSHNNYIDIISQTGLPGFLAFVAIWVGIAVVSVRTCFIVPKGGFEQAAAYALLAANLSTFITMALGDWVTPFTYTQGLGGIDYTIWAWILGGLTIAFHHILRSRQSGEAVST